jgi:hypothetical protein
MWGAPCRCGSSPRPPQARAFNRNPGFPQDSPNRREYRQNGRKGQNRHLRKVEQWHLTRAADAVEKKERPFEIREEDSSTVPRTP